MTLIDVHVSLLENYNLKEIFFFPKLSTITHYYHFESSFKVILFYQKGAK